MAEKKKVGRFTITSINIASTAPPSHERGAYRLPRLRRPASTTFTASLAAFRRPLTTGRPPSPQVAEAKSKLLVAKTKAMEMKAKVMQDVTPAQMRADRKAMYEMVCKQVRPPNLPSHLVGAGPVV